MPIRYKLGLIVAGLSFIILTMFLFTWYITSSQKADGLEINLAGRQRMLSQKMTKELYSFAVSDEAKTREERAADAFNTMQVFDLTLTALIESGKVPLTLNLKGEYVQCSKVGEPALSQLKKVKTSWTAYQAHMEKILAGKGDNPASMEFIKQNNLGLLRQMDEAVTTLQRMSEKKVSILILFQSGCLVIAIILLVVSIAQILGIVKNLLQSSDTAKAMGRGDLTKRFTTADRPVEKLDELDFLGHNLNGFASSLRDNIREIYQEALTLSSASAQMSTVAAALSGESSSSATKTVNVAGHAKTMSEDMNAVAAAMEELNANTQQIAHSTARMSDTSRDIAENAQQASRISDQAVQQVESASARVDDLGNAAAKIGKVSETITEISGQTNLLALNATIEAARAGEAGKGFAVVANEIKELAHQTARATEQIKESIQWIQGSTSSTVDDIKEIAQVISRVNEIVRSISASVADQTETLSGINLNVSQGADALQEVSSNVASTSVRSVEIAGDVEDVSQSISLVSKNSHSIASNAEQLSQLAAKLHTMVNRFTID